MVPTDGALPTDGAGVHIFTYCLQMVPTDGAGVCLLQMVPVFTYLPTDGAGVHIFTYCEYVSLNR